MCVRERERERDRERDRERESERTDGHLTLWRDEFLLIFAPPNTGEMPISAFCPF